MSPLAKQQFGFGSTNVATKGDHDNSSQDISPGPMRGGTRTTRISKKEWNGIIQGRRDRMKWEWQKLQFIKLNWICGELAMTSYPAESWLRQVVASHHQGQDLSDAQIWHLFSNETRESRHPTHCMQTSIKGGGGPFKITEQNTLSSHISSRGLSWYTYLSSRLKQRQRTTSFQIVSLNLEHRNPFSE